MEWNMIISFGIFLLEIIWPKTLLSPFITARRPLERPPSSRTIVTVRSHLEPKQWFECISKLNWFALCVCCVGSQRLRTVLMRINCGTQRWTSENDELEYFLDNSSSSGSNKNSFCSLNMFFSFSFVHLLHQMAWHGTRRYRCRYSIKEHRGL